MLDGLAGVVAAVVDNAVAVAQSERLGDFGDLGEDIRDDIRVVLIDRVGTADVLLGYDEHMHGSLRIEVIEAYNFIVLVNLFGRNGTVNDFTENTVGQDCHPLSEFYKIGFVHQLLLYYFSTEKSSAGRHFLRADRFI